MRSAIDHMTRIKGENEELKKELAKFKHRDESHLYRQWTQQPFTTLPVAPEPEMIGVAANAPSANLASSAHAAPAQVQSIPQQPLSTSQPSE